MKLCPKCQKHFSDDANFCPVDAARLIPLEAPASGGDSLTAKYTVGTRIGGARTGVVYRATDVATQAAVAVKVVSPGVAALPGVGPRLERELKQLERVQSTGVAKVMASGKRTTAAGEETWVAYELVEGAHTLAEAISARGPIPLAQAAQLIEVIGEAIIEAAQVGVVHRDLAPKNVLFAASTVAGTSDIKLINFSLPVPQPGSDKVPGVPEFVAPEQVDGKPVDQRSNLYSLGALYYYVLTGQTVHTGSADEVHRSHANAVIKLPSTLALVPPTVEAVIMRALDRSPTKRFLTVRQFVDEVGRTARGESDPKATQALGKTGRPKAELVQTLLGVRSFEDDGLVLTGPAAIAAHAAHAAHAAPSASPGSVTIGPGALRAPAAMPTPLAPQPAVLGSPAQMGNVTIGPGAGSTSLPDPSPAAPAPPVAPARSPLTAAAADPSPWSPPASPVMPAAVAPAMAVPVALPQYAAPVAPPQYAAPVAPVMPAPPVAPVLAAPQLGAAVAAGKKKAPVAEPAGGKAKGKFRETMWFKKGELDADAAQTAADERETTGTSTADDKVDTLPIDDRYKDDGTISRGDAEKYSLRTGGTQMMAAVRDPGASAAGASMTGVSADALIDEMKGGRKLWLILVVAGLAGLAFVLYMLAS